MGEPWTLAEAQDRLAQWLQAADAVATGQSYTIGNRSLQRTNLREINKQIVFWRAEVERLQAGRSAGIRVIRAVPTDY